MLILDALRRSISSQEVYFLLTCYVDSLQFYGTGKRLPAGVTALPLHNLQDIEARCLTVRQSQRLEPAATHTQTSGDSDAAILDEVAEVFGVAINCLKALEFHAAAAVVQGRTPDIQEFM